MPATRRVEFCFASKSLLYICLFEDRGTNNHKMQKVAPLCARRRCDRIPGRNRVGRMSRSASWFQKLQFGVVGKAGRGSSVPGSRRMSWSRAVHIAAARETGNAGGN